MPGSEFSIQFYNTERKRKEPFHPLKPNEVSLYTCGPTVYDYAHIGNFRAYVFEDLLKRYLTFRGFAVKHVMNLTDVEDKIIRMAREKEISIEAHTAPFIESFFEDLNTLNVERAECYPRATEHIEEMIALIRSLQEKGHTYERDGSIYYKISTFPTYGRLSGIRLGEVKVGARIDADEYDKEDARDFVLWKARKEGEHYWSTELGEGRPGWHIECSAMSMRYLGEQLDIHCGGEDNIFPHHENEIAQSESVTGRRFVNTWLHCRHLMVDGEKMSKSKGNFYTLRDLVQKGHSPMAIRYFLVSSHYRSPINLTEEALQAAHAAWSRIMDFCNRLEELAGAAHTAAPCEALEEQNRRCLEQFTAHLDDDLDSPRALAALFDFIREANKILDTTPVSPRQGREVLEMMQRLDRVLGVMKREAGILDEEIERMIQERQEARKRKDYARADAIRDALAQQGVILEDTREGMRWKRR